MPDPHPNPIDVAAGRAELAAIKGRMHERAQRAADLSRGHTPTDNEVFQHQSNMLAERNPLYSAARVAANFGPIVPLEPQGTEPLVELAEATRDNRIILDWWRRFPNANPGVACGKASNLLVLRITGEQGRAWLSKLLLEPVHTTKNRFGDQFEVGTPRSIYDFAGVLRLSRSAPPAGPALQLSGGQAKELEDQLRRQQAERRSARGQATTGYYMAWPTSRQTYTYVDTDHHGVTSEREGTEIATDLAWSFPTGEISDVVEVLADGAVCPWHGSVFFDGSTVERVGHQPEAMHIWLAEAIGTRKGRK